MPRDARPYRTPVEKAMAFPNKVVKEKLRNTGNRAILQISGEGQRQSATDPNKWHMLSKDNECIIT